MRTVHELTDDEKCLHQLEDYTTDGGVRVRWYSGVARSGLNVWRVTRGLAPNLFIVQYRDTENARGMGDNAYAWGLTVAHAQSKLNENPAPAAKVMTEALEYLAALVVQARLGLKEA